MIQHRAPFVLLIAVGAVLGIVVVVGLGWLGGLVHSREALKLVGYSSIGSSTAAFLWWILGWKLWRFSWIQRLLNIPNLHGRWEGWYFDTINYEWRPTAHEIDQHVFSISAEAFGGAGKQSVGRSNRSEGLACQLRLLEHRKAKDPGCELHWTYRTTNRTETGGNHEGAHIMRLVKNEECEFLEGEYINNRKRDHPNIGQFSERDPRRLVYGSTGRIIVMRTLKPATGDISFDEGVWAMCRPTTDPATADFSEIRLVAVTKACQRRRQDALPGSRDR